MNETPLPELQGSPEHLAHDIASLRSAVVTGAEPILARWGLDAGNAHPSLLNLAHYVSLRQIDLRPLQRQLMALGLSSLGRLESRVMPSLDALHAVLARLTSVDAPPPRASADFFAGEMRLAAATDALFGRSRAHRRGRIMVTLPGDAAETPGLLPDLVRCGMDVARINCAHDDAETWRRLSRDVRAAGRELGQDITVLMDIAGPKIRTEAVKQSKKSKRLDVGDRFRLVAEGEPELVEGIDFCATVSEPSIVHRLAAGDRLRYDDGKIDGIVETADGHAAIIRVKLAKAGGAKLKPEKGLNVPDTDLGLSPLTAKDEQDLATVLECADMIGYSFVRRPDDISLLETAISRLGFQGPRPGLVAKIEQPEAVRYLPDMIARAVPHWRFSVMIARGDLAAEIGFERLAEMQEEILWICEAADVPAIWATQVLEDLVKDGVPSRGEMTDAAMSARAECVMLNKGPAIREAVAILDTLLGRMEGHMLKKTPVLRALGSWA